MTNENNMKDFLEQYDVKEIRKGEILDGTVIDVNEKEVKVNINYAFDGIVSREDFSWDDINPKDVVKAGDKIKVSVLSKNDGEGLVLLSRKNVLVVEEREAIKKAFDNQETLTLKIKEEVKGGLISNYGSLRVFIPGSQVAMERVTLKDFIGKDLDVRIIELDLRNNKIVASKRAIEAEEYEKNQKKIWANLKEGEKVSGIVKNTTKYGAFVDIGGVQGLIHINDLAWERVKRVEDVVKPLDKVEVFIGNIDRENRKLSLVLKDTLKEPWTVHGESIKKGQILDGKVVRLAKFGAFVEVFKGVEGLVHLSEIIEDPISKVEEVLSVGKTVKVKVLNIDRENKKLSLSIKDASEKSKEYLEYTNNDDDVTLGDVFANLKDMFK